MKKLILLSALYGAFFGINTMKAQDADFLPSSGQTR